MLQKSNNNFLLYQNQILPLFSLYQVTIFLQKAKILMSQSWKSKIHYSSHSIILRHHKVVKYILFLLIIFLEAFLPKFASLQLEISCD